MAVSRIPRLYKFVVPNPQQKSQMSYGDGENAYYSTSPKLIMVNGEGKNAFHSIAAKQME